MTPQFRFTILFFGLLALALLSSCSSTAIPPGFYGCADVDAYFTDSRARIVKLPDNTELTPELAEILCG